MFTPPFAPCSVTGKEREQLRWLPHAPRQLRHDGQTSLEFTLQQQQKSCLRQRHLLPRGLLLPCLLQQLFVLLPVAQQRRCRRLCCSQERQCLIKALSFEKLPDLLLQRNGLQTQNAAAGCKYDCTASGV